MSEWTSTDRRSVVSTKSRYSSRPDPTTRVLSRGGVIEYRACKYPHTTSTEHEPKQQCTARAGASDGSPPCLGESSHRWVPVNTPQYTGAVTTGGCGWLSTDQQHTTATDNEPRLVSSQDPFTRFRENFIAS